MFKRKIVVATGTGATALALIFGSQATGWPGPATRPASATTQAAPPEGCDQLYHNCDPGPLATATAEVTPDPVSWGGPATALSTCNPGYVGPVDGPSPSPATVTAHRAQAALAA
jgi:hypothetical protein